MVGTPATHQLQLPRQPGHFPAQSIVLRQQRLHIAGDPLFGTTAAGPVTWIKTQSDRFQPKGSEMVELQAEASQIRAARDLAQSALLALADANGRVIKTVVQTKIRPRNGADSMAQAIPITQPVCTTSCDVDAIVQL